MDQIVTSPDEPERWLPVVDYEGLYEVSDLGRVRSLPRITQVGRRRRRCAGRMLKLQGGGKHYYHVTLYRDGATAQRTVHSLVAEAFIGPRPDGQQVRHGPGGQFDNRPANLSYGTVAENAADKHRDGTAQVGTKSAFAVLTDAVVLECRARAAAGERLSDLARELGVSYNAVFCAATGRTWPHLPAGPSPHRPVSVAARIAADLESRLRSGELGSGSRVPPLDALAAQYGVGTSTACNAVNILRESGLIAGRGWSRSFVLRTPCGTGWPMAA